MLPFLNQKVDKLPEKDILAFQWSLISEHSDEMHFNITEFKSFQEQYRKETLPIPTNP